MFGAEFSVFADCGAGWAITALSYNRMLTAGLPADAQPAAAIYCYEPLPENIAELAPRLTTIPAHPAAGAVGEVAGPQSFSVPAPDDRDGVRWGNGTSALARWARSQPESVTVDVVRLEDEAVERFDFVQARSAGRRAGCI